MSGKPARRTVTMGGTRKVSFTGIGAGNWLTAVNGAGNYRTTETEEEAYLQFVENVEAIIAEEQQIYWQARRGDLGRLEPDATKAKR